MKQILRVALGAVLVGAVILGALATGVSAPVATAKSGKGATQTGSAYAGWIYTEANNPTPNKNAVVAIPYTDTGIPVVAQARLYPTDGSGTPLVLPMPNSVGTTAGDHQVLLSPDHKLLFAVNQGSNTITVFNVDSANGALTPISGSPFSSYGMAPIALGYSGGILTVANHGIIAPFDPLGSSPPGPSDLVSFKVGPTGALTKVSSTPPHPDGAIDATISPDGKTVVSSGFYPEIVPGASFPTFGPQLIRSFTLSPKGVLSPVDALSFPSDFSAGLAAKLPPVVPKVLYPLPIGVAFNPDPAKKFVYLDAAVASRVTVYNYSDPAKLTLVSNAINPGLAACWIVVSKDGRFLYDSNSATQNISIYSISSDGSTLKLIGTVPLKSKGTTNSLALDPSGGWLYILGNHDDPDAPRPEGTPLSANYLDAYRVDQTTGLLKEIATVKLPVLATNVAYGLDVLPR
jgi:WD40 repeat protein